MQKKLTFFLFAVLVMATTNAQVFFCAETTNGVFEVYKNSVKIATTTDTSITNMLTSTATTMNPPATIQNNQVLVNGNWIPLPTGPTSDIHVVVGDTVMCLTSDSIWFLTTTGWNYTPGSFGGAFPQSFDLIIENDSLCFITLSNHKVTYRSAGTSGTQGSFFTEHITKVHLLKNVSYTVTGSTITLGTISAIITNPVSLHECIPAGNAWCLMATGPDVYKLQTTTYITQAYRLGLDSSEYYGTVCEIQAAATHHAFGTFLTALDVPQSQGLPKTNYVFTLNTESNAVPLGETSQRLFIHRIQPSGYGTYGMFQFDLGFFRYQNGSFWSGDGRDNGNNRLNQYNSYGEFMHSYKATDMHDGMVLGDFTYAFGYGDSGSYFITPPMAISNVTNDEYTPSSDQLYPLVADSCNLASSVLLFGSGDIDHGNSVQAFFVPARQQHMVVRSARNLAKYPASFPMCAWWFDPATKQFSLDYQLTDLLNASPFGIDRDGGHDLQVEMELSDSMNNTWIITQFDNRACDNSLAGPSYGHSATVHYDLLSGWSLSDFRRFKASPSTAMGGIDCYPAGTDTFVVIATATNFGNGISNIYSTPQAVVSNFSTKEPVAGFDFFSQKKEPAIAYQVNATHELVRIPEIQLTASETQHEVIVTASNVPTTGNWFWWLGNKSLQQPLVLQKSSLPDGVSVYASGWYSDADTIPLVPHGPRSRWVTQPIWIPSQITGIDSYSPLEITLFPNPTTDFIEVRGISGDGWFVEVMSMQGASVFSGSVTDGHIWLPESIASGVYIVRLSHKRHGASTKKITVF